MARRKAVILTILVLMILAIVFSLPKLVLALLAAVGLYSYVRKAHIHEQRRIK